jgi:hypothetical protein
MLDIKHCQGCHDNFYNPGCWSRESAKLVSRIPIGVDEPPPYKNKKKQKVPCCWHGGGGNRTIMVKPESITKDGYWKMF